MRVQVERKTARTLLVFVLGLSLTGTLSAYYERDPSVLDPPYWDASVSPGLHEGTVFSTKDIEGEVQGSDWQETRVSSKVDVFGKHVIVSPGTSFSAEFEAGVWANCDISWQGAAGADPGLDVTVQELSSTGKARSYVYFWGQDYQRFQGSADCAVYSSSSCESSLSGQASCNESVSGYLYGDNILEGNFEGGSLGYGYGGTGSESGAQEWTWYDSPEPGEWSAAIYSESFTATSLSLQTTATGLGDFGAALMPSDLFGHTMSAEVEAYAWASVHVLCSEQTSP